MNLGAGTAGTHIAHLPEVVLHAAREDARLGHVAHPERFRLEVLGHAKLRVALEVGDVEALGIDAVRPREELPRPGDGVLLEVVAEGPVAEHLEEGVVVHVLANVVKVVVLAARADALLRVGRALELRHLGGRVGLAEEDGLELVHARVDEEEGRVVERHDGGGRPEGVRHTLGLAEKVDERLSHLGGGCEFAHGSAALRLEQICDGEEGRGRARDHRRVDAALDHVGHVVRL
mmetsp:Transcript_8482/g.19812  ORF Transcript_8482/g.19812 Transcript_8482/m.19812 type:complete len:233 (+) Transcript_8482:2545-3243(+)